MNQNIICWFEIYVENIERAKNFYSEVLGTQFTDSDMPGDTAETQMKMAFFSSPENQGVSGALIEMPGAKEGGGDSLNTMVYFPCMDCAVETVRVAAAGGKVKDAKMSIGDFGFCSICMDTEGNFFGLHSMQ